MKISWNWLQDWIDLSDLTPDEVAHRLTMAGLEVEGIERIGEGADDIVVGRIDKISEHPDADKLVICDVSFGADESARVVCGATNMAEGDLVPYAKPGSQPPGVDFEIVARKVRGVLSSGMLCSRVELDLPEDVDGLWILDPELVPGTPIFEAAQLKDIIIEVDLTPNRPDCLGHLGVARELSALYQRPLKTPTGFGEAPLWESNGAQASGEKASDAANLTVEDAEGCPRYLFAVLEDVKVAPSPAWLRARVEAIGLRSVNNIVDITNYILMELNQPLHVFDLGKLNGPEIRVRRARAGEKIVGIDHNEYKLDPADLVIADAAQPVAIAGVMGGEESEVDFGSTRVLVECAYFEPTTVRRSARRHNLHTDSSHRFERGIDPAGLPAALARALRLMMRTQQELGHQAKVRRGIAEVSAEGVTEPTRVALPLSLPKRILGVEFSQGSIRQYLSALDIDVSQKVAGGELLCTVPTFRPDLSRPVDLVEELARLYGYENIPATLPRSLMGASHRPRAEAGSAAEESAHPDTLVTTQERHLLQTIRTQLLSFGLYEAVNYGFMSPDELNQLGIPEGDRRRDTARLANPLVADESLMQTTLLPGLLKNLKTNLARRTEDVALFELGRRYFVDEERPTLGILLSGRKLTHWSDKKAWDFYDIKGLVEAISRPFSTGALRWEPPAPIEPFLHPGVQARWATAEGETIATIGRLHPSVASDLDIDAEVYLAEVYLDALFSLGLPAATFSRLPRYPAVTRDFALTYAEDAPYSKIEDAIKRLASEDADFGNILESFELFDVYAGEQVGPGRRSLAMSLVYRSADSTLTDKQVERADKRLLAWLDEQTQATLRG